LQIKRRDIMKMRFVATIFSIMVFASFIVAGCDGSGNSGESVNWEGETMPAVIDTSSAEGMAVDATLSPFDDYEGGSDPLGLGEGGSGVLEIVANPAKAFDFASRFVNGDEVATYLDVSARPLVVDCTEPERFYGDEGYFEIYGCADSEDEDWFKIDFKFVGYDYGDVFINGRLIISGTESEQKIVFRDLVTQSDFEDSYLDGWVEYEDDTAGQVVTITYNLAVIDSFNDEAHWLDDYVIVADYDSDEVTLSGNFYDFEEGYVTLTTETVLDWDLTMGAEGLEWADHPTGGTVKLTGADGYWISITFSPTGFYIEVNFMGDEGVDATIPDIGEIPWV
jgi:hypothetical protein